MEELAFKLSGIIGLLCIIAGVYIRKAAQQTDLFALGGLFLLLYSIHLRDVIFITLQTVFIISSLYERYVSRIKKT